MSGLEALAAEWRRRWPDALALWSRYTQLSDPHWCVSKADEEREGLSGSFAMLRLGDKAVVISLAQVRKLGLEAHPLEVLGHEIGHHVFCPADLTDQARMLARMRAALPTREGYAPMLANLYADLLINDRLQRDRGLDMAGLYKALKAPQADGLWTLYMRTYEVLWGLAPGTLAGKASAELEGDARLAARVVRSYARDWLEGAGRFAALCFPYLAEPPKGTQAILAAWEELTPENADGEGVFPAGLSEAEDGEREGAVHPSEDQPGGVMSNPLGSLRPAGRHERTPIEYKELLEALGLRVSEGDAASRYYKEKALPHLVDFPVKEEEASKDPLPEGLEPWDPGSPFEELDWVESAARSPQAIPGYTTLRRVYGTDSGSDRERLPLDLYIGVDCSGSMVNPRLHLSYPVLAGAVMGLSALRAGAEVMVCLSGEPGRAVATKGFSRDEREVLGVLTDYLGTGYTFGIPRLKAHFPEHRRRPAHILIITDFDIFSSLGWETAAAALAAAGGGGTYVLHAGSGADKDPRVRRMTAEGWDVHLVTSQEQMLAFAKAFSRRKYGARTAA